MSGVEPGLTELLLLALLGGVVALDGVAAVQSMISRPLVAGWLGGMVLGDPMTGVRIGVLLELQLLVAVPSGGGAVPEGGIATLVAVAAAVAPGGLPPAGALAWGVALGLLWGQLAGRTQLWLRRINEDPLPEGGLPGPGPDEVRRIQLRGLALDAGRGALVTAVGVGVARIGAPVIAAGWRLPAEPTFALLLLGAWVSVGILLRGVAGHRGRIALFGLGLLLGVLWTGVEG